MLRDAIFAWIASSSFIKRPTHVADSVIVNQLDASYPSYHVINLILQRGRQEEEALSALRLYCIVL